MPANYQSLVYQIESSLDWQQSVEDRRPTIIMYWTKHCRISHEIKPTFEALARRYQNINFRIVDVDDCIDIRAKQAVVATPTFETWRNTTCQDRFVGSNAQRLESSIVQLAAGSY